MLRFIIKNSTSNIPGLYKTYAGIRLVFTFDPIAIGE